MYILAIQKIYCINKPQYIIELHSESFFRKQCSITTLAYSYFCSTNFAIATFYKLILNFTKKI